MSREPADVVGDAEQGEPAMVGLPTSWDVTCGDDMYQPVEYEQLTAYYYTQEMNKDDQHACFEMQKKVGKAILKSDPHLGHQQSYSTCAEDSAGGAGTHEDLTTVHAEGSEC